MKRHWLPRIPLVALFGLLAITMWFWWIYTEAFVSDDSYFYLVTARHLALTGEQTFSGVYTTNGLHPLWLYALTAYTWVLAWFSQDAVHHVAFAVPLSGLFLITGALLLWRAARRLALPPDFIVIPAVAFVAIFGVLYSEAHLLFFAAALLILIVVGTDRNRISAYLLIGVANAVLILSRLDAVFWIGPLLFWLWLLDRSQLRVALSAAMTAALVAPYLVANLAFFGGPMPVSGLLKSSFPDIFWGRGWETYTIPSISWEGYSVPFGFVPLTICIVAILAIGRKRLKKATVPEWSLVWVFAGGTALHCLYIVLFTKFHTTWYWYYVLPVIGGCIALAAVAEAVRIPHRLLSIGVLVVVALAVSGLVVDKSTEGVTGRPAYVLEYLNRYEITNRTILISDYPGAVAFHSDNRIVAADMLTGNIALTERLRNSDNALKELWAVTEEEGYPIDLVVFAGNGWLVPDVSGRCLEYRDPRDFPDLRPFGWLRVPEPVYRSGPYTIVWSMDDINSSVGAAWERC